jgi:maltose alpha-D-glucosyltransferase/alpha-amylase
MKYQDGIAPKEGSRNRAGSRTPMQWTPGPTAGFSTCAPAQLYFPVATDGGKLTVEAEEKDPGSMLNYVKRLLALRASVPALGNDAGWQLLNTLDGEQYPMVYLRTAASGERCLVALNPSEKAVTLRTGQPAGKVLVSTGKGSYKHGTVKLAPFSAIIVRL